MREIVEDDSKQPLNSTINSMSLYYKGVFAFGCGIKYSKNYFLFNRSANFVYLSQNLKNLSISFSYIFL